jgi:two-component system phosphate regulon sensor histidine kinase PhoR
MKEKLYKKILALIGVVIITTIGIQFFWNWKLFQQTSQEIHRSIQQNIDSSIKDYFTLFTKENAQELIISSDTTKDYKFWENIPDSIFTPNKNKSKGIVKIIQNSNDDFKHLISGDSIQFDISTSLNVVSIDSFKFSENRVNELKGIFSEIIYALDETPINLSVIDSIFQYKNEIQGIEIGHQIYLNTPVLNHNRTYDNLIRGHSTILPVNEKILVNYSITTLSVLKRQSFGIILSFILIASILIILFFLLSIIQKQKSIHDIKNDFLSNISHEFKTPIATMTIAQENILEQTDSETIKRYATISEQQLNRLTKMVDGLLDLSLLQKEKILLTKESVNMSNFIETIVEKHKTRTESKKIEIDCLDKDILWDIDRFHFESVLDNLIDNAIKYGGNKITISLIKKKHDLQLSVIDNGKDLPKKNLDKLFEKFYRNPSSGDTYQQNGYGIGLHYVKLITEAHNGTVKAKANPTTFTIQLKGE